MTIDQDRLTAFPDLVVSMDDLVADSLGHYYAAEYQRQIEHGAE